MLAATFSSTSAVVAEVITGVLSFKSLILKVTVVAALVFVPSVAVTSKL